MIVRMTVNGTGVEIDADPRHTLADTLRDRLRLTGVHLGCEHGVCGMCTVLVDGRAVRSCLLFAVLADGSDATTVEGLGTPSRLHPLQQAFHTHHALQCGFCTPAFLLSAYELLRDNPALDGVDLAGKLSGVLCRCTATSRSSPPCARSRLLTRTGRRLRGTPATTGPLLPALQEHRRQTPGGTDRDGSPQDHGAADPLVPARRVAGWIADLPGFVLGTAAGVHGRVQL
jgi:aerobic-type carbon monoxide dehydrogenase small subunit (CoxS/CutS family)